MRIAAFSSGTQGGNPAGVWLGDRLPDEAWMQRMAADIGFSETVFACPAGDGWRVRYFSPQAEVPFCGHATIALGYALTARDGEGSYPLQLNHGKIGVEGLRDGGQSRIRLKSPPTWSRPADGALVEEALALFGYHGRQLDDRLPPALAHGGADHLILALNSRQALSEMTYDFAAGQRFTRAHGLTTIMWVWAEDDRHFHSRNAFAYGGVYEDPATGAASAAFAGYLRDLHWPHGGRIDIIQGEDMGCLCQISAEISPEEGSPVLISGEARVMADGEAAAF